MTEFVFLPDPYRHRQTLFEIARALASNLELPRVLQLTVEHAVRLLAGDAGLVALRRPDDQFAFFAGVGIPPDQWAHFRPLLDKLPLDLAREGWQIPALRGGLVQSAQGSGLDLAHVIAMPMVAQRVLVGVIFLFRRRVAHPFTQYDEQVLVPFAEQAAIALRNAIFVQQLRDERARLATVLAHAADGVLLLDDAGRVLEINPAMSRLSGWGPEAAIGQYGSRIIALITPNGVPLAWPPLPPGASETPELEGFLICADGQRGPYVSALFAPLGNLQQAAGVVVTVRDLTARHEAETAKRTFIAGISHELKTPLALILGYAETLARTDVTWTPAQVQESLGIIREETLRLTRMVDDLLDLARIEAGGLELHPVSVELGGLAREVVGTVAGAQSSHRFNLIGRSELALTQADPDLLTQALRILLNNAVKYSPPGTQVDVEVWVEDAAVGLRVADEGPGIPEAERERIFERFVRGREQPQREGAGLGLALARAIVQAHGGQLWVTDRAPAQGALFHLALPRERQREMER
jgi:PAS domain S-box-containing protein